MWLACVLLRFCFVKAGRTDRLRPGRPQREVDRLCDPLDRLALSKAPAPHRKVNRAFNASEHPGVLDEATN